jgi:hypothetical protein
MNGQDGANGSKGATGDRGPQGTDGYVGSRGSLGYTGSIGPTGVTGDTGYVGSIGATGPSIYDISNFLNGFPLANEIVMRVILTRTFTIPADFVGSYAFTTHPASDYDVKLGITKNGAQLGTVTFAVGSYLGTWAGTGSAIVYNVSDQLHIQVDNTVHVTPDSTFSDFAFTIKGSAV